MFSYNGTFGIHYPILPDESPKLDPEDIEHVCKVAVQQPLYVGRRELQNFNACSSGWF